MFHVEFRPARINRYGDFAMAGPFLIDHRRDRQQARRILAAYRNRWRVLGSSFRTELDPVLDGHDRLDIPHPCVFTRSRA